MKLNEIRGQPYSWADIEISWVPPDGTELHFVRTDSSVGFGRYINGGLVTLQGPVKPHDFWRYILGLPQPA